MSIVSSEKRIFYSSVMVGLTKEKLTVLCISHHCCKFATHCIHIAKELNIDEEKFHSSTE
jgi:hypothetical protein